MTGHVEGETPLARLPAEVCPCENQVGRAGDREKLGEPLNDPEQRRFQRSQDARALRLSRFERAGTRGEVTA